MRSTESTIVVEVERDERARVDHLDLDAVLGGEPLGRRERVVDEPRERDDRDVAALAQRRGLADRHRPAPSGTSPVRK